jgi:uncharacterized membrane protein
MSTPTDFPAPNLFEATVTQVTSSKSGQLLHLTSLANQDFTVQTDTNSFVSQSTYSVDDQVVVTTALDSTGHPYYTITDFVRRSSLLTLLVIFVVLTVVIGKWRGFTSLLGLAVSFGVIFFYLLPQLYAGADPVATALTSSLFIIPATFYLSHGVNKKTTSAIIGTLISLIITGALANYFVDAAHLTGFASEEASFLQVARGEEINIKGLLLAGIIIGVLGVLDDITVSQSSVVFELKNSSPRLMSKTLYQRAMNVGQDHISSMVNTLVLVYTGAALPLLLLFVDSALPFSHLVNYEIIADEIVRTLVGSIGLICAVPITTLIAAIATDYDTKK